MLDMIQDLNVKIFADGAKIDDILEIYACHPYIKGFTTNPSLIHKAGIIDYRMFAKEVLQAIPDLPISFEVLADDLKEMEHQALEISSWGLNVYVKMPVMNTHHQSSYDLLNKLANSGVKMNATAITTLEQVRSTAEAFAGGAPCFISVFAGRIADTGRDPIPFMAKALDLLKPCPNVELIWASSRELLNVFQANTIGCHIITVTSDILRKFPLIGRNLYEVSFDVVKMFHEDTKKAGYIL